MEDASTWLSWLVLNSSTERKVMSIEEWTEKYEEYSKLYEKAFRELAPQEGNYKYCVGEIIDGSFAFSGFSGNYTVFEVYDYPDVFSVFMETDKLLAWIKEHEQ